MLKAFLHRNEALASVSTAVLFPALWFLLGPAWFRDLPSLLQDVSWLGIVAVGEAVVVISGEFDLSVGSVYAFVSLIFVLLIDKGIDPTWALLLCLGIGSGIGLLNGLLTWVMKLPSLLITLGFLFVYRGLVDYVTNGFPVSLPEHVHNHGALALLGGQTFGLTNSVYICLIIVGIFTFLLAKGRFGSHLYAVGGDVRAATATGVPSGWVKIRAFMLCAVLASLAGIAMASNLSAVSTTTATAMEFEAIAACVIGGCSIFGGSGSAWGALLGVATLLILKHALILQGVNIFTYQMVLGVVLVGLAAMKGVFPRLFAAH